MYVVLQIGEAVLRSYVFIHLEQPADKLQLLLAMMHKLYAMITRQCCDDNPDGLIHHEVSLCALRQMTLFEAIEGLPLLGAAMLSNASVPCFPRQIRHAATYAAESWTVQQNVSLTCHEIACKNLLDS